MSLLRTRFKHAISALGADHVARRWNRRKLLICCYHGVRDDSEPTHHWLMLPRAEFVAQMEYLRAHYDCLPLADALHELDGPFRRRRPIACVTFDDGYLNNRTIAYPILADLDIPATIYLSTGFIGTSRALWTTTLELALAQGAGLLLDLSMLGMARFVVERAGLKRLTMEIIGRLKRLAPATREPLANSLLNQLPPPLIPDAFRFMTWPDVSALASSGMITMGAHTVNHELLSRLATPDLAFEITNSIATISAQTGERVLTFAYPNGTTADFDERCKRLVRDAGCIAAVSTRYGLNGHNEDSFALRRVVIGAFDTLASFRLRCAGIPGAR